MDLKGAVSRRTFVGGLAAALSYVSWQSENLLAQGRRGGPPQGQAPGAGRGASNVPVTKLSNNENPYGPSEAVKKAMADAFKYAHLYGTPDNGLMEALVKLHGVQRENMLLGCGSGEILQLAGTAFVIGNQKKVVGVEPTYNDVFSQATSIKAESYRVPLLRDYRQDIPAMIKAVKNNYRDVGMVYLCNPNNPTGLIVTKQEVRQLLDGIPEDVPVLIDEAYHHFVEDPNYETAIPYVLQGRPVIVARTFSKIAGLAAMRLGYAVARPDLLARMRTYQTGSQSVAVRFGAAAALADTASQERVKRLNTELRTKVTTELKSLGHDCIPSDANFFMVHVKREVQGVIQDFRQKNISVGRPFPPMTQHLRVSIGTPEEMDKFMVAFKEIFVNKTSAAGGAA
ncbi:MAG: aminotransferase class I/II-fold pyridoxal phosphate-dependent enzyme [Acidobacteria bacterium]|nr:aminotransferase class I/II-fold pyridoxal phosphate-dependent enzyme [Acidobacteriota bacterium]